MAGRRSAVNGRLDSSGRQHSHSHTWRSALAANVERSRDDEKDNHRTALKLTAMPKVNWLSPFEQTSLAPCRVSHPLDQRQVDMKVADKGVAG